MMKEIFLFCLLGINVTNVASQAVPPLKTIAESFEPWWSMNLNTPFFFDKASEEEIKSFVTIMNELGPLSTNFADVVWLTGVIAPNMSNIAIWRDEMKATLLKNFHAATNNVFKLRIQNWTALVDHAFVTLQDDSKSRDIPGLWDRQRFYSNYFYEEVRKAALFSKVTTGFKKLDQDEIFGDELGDKEFVLSFGGGPSIGDNSTETLIEVLKREDTPAVFTLTGANVELFLKNKTGPVPEPNGEVDLDFTEQSKKKDEFRDLYGGFCIGSQSYYQMSHDREVSEVKESITSMKDLLRRLFPDTIFKDGPDSPIYFRAPFGARNAEVLKFLKQTKHKSFLWSIDSQDWTQEILFKFPDQAYLNRIKRLMLLKRKGIILFTEGFPLAANILPELTAFAKSAGLKWLDCDGLDKAVEMFKMAEAENVH